MLQLESRAPGSALSTVGLVLGLVCPAAALQSELQPPTSFQASEATQKSIKLTWVAAAGAARYEVQRKSPSSGSYAPLHFIDGVELVDDDGGAGLACRRGIAVLRQCIGPGDLQSDAWSSERS